MDDTRDVAMTGRRIDERVHVLSRGYIDRRDTRLVSDVT